eukprot:2227387-Amphidinium_carterae.1
MVHYISLMTEGGLSTLQRAVSSASIIVGTWPTSLSLQTQDLILDALRHGLPCCIVLLLFQRQRSAFARVREQLSNCQLFYASAGPCNNPSYRRLGIALNCAPGSSLQLVTQTYKCAGDGMPRKWARA